MKKFLSLYFIFIILLIVSSYGNNSDDYKMQPGDVLQISVLNEEDLSRELRVSSAGNINVPLLGEVNIRNLTSFEITNKLTKLFNEYLVNPQVTIFVVTFAKVFISGEVKKPGAYELSKPLTIMESITIAGGFSEHANKKKVKLIRKIDGVKETRVIDISSFINKGNIHDEDVVLKPGDLVIVPESFL